MKPVARVRRGSYAGASPRTFVYLPYVDAEAAGMQRYASQMILALRRAGLNFELIIGELHGRPAWLGDLDFRVALPTRAARLPRPIAALGRLLWLQLRFAAATGASREDIFLALGHELPSFPRTRQIAVAHDLTDFKAYSGRGSVATRARNRLWAAGLRRAETVIAISAATRADLVAQFDLASDRVEVVYEGVDAALFNARERVPTAPPSYLLYAGTLDPHKNVPFLLEVFGRLRATFEDVQLKLVGRHDPDRRKALAEAMPAATARAVEFLGFVSDEALAELMRGCAAFVFPSRNEGFGLAPVEAMACGAPVLAADAGSLPEVVGDGGILLSPDDSRAWVDELAKLLSDDTYRAGLSARAIERAGLFSWDEAAQSYVKLIREAI